MLRPQENAVREAKRLDGIWDFAFDPGGAGRKEGWWERRLADAQPMAVPSSYNDVPTDPAAHDHVGDVWYQRTVHVPSGWTGRRIVLRFDSATHRALVWVGGGLVLDHEGGYTPFEADVTHLVTPGEEVRLTAVVNNELTMESIPPGIVEVKPDGTRRQNYYHDFFNYAGLHRSVWLYATGPTHIADVTVTTDLDDGAGVVRYATLVDGHVGPDADADADAEAQVQVRLRESDGSVVAEGAGPEGVLRVHDPELWRPGHGHLYDLETDLLVDGQLVDRYTVPVGIRTVRVEGTRFLINDEPFYFRGFGMHEDHNVRGKGHDDASMLQDFALFGWTGANSFRTSHYPYAEEVLDHADRLGIVVIDETAAVGLNLAGGLGLLFGGAKVTYTEETIGSATQQVHRRAIEELVSRDKNHPSVVVWSLANEPESNSDAARSYFEPLFKAARAADPTRPVGFVNMGTATPETCTVTPLADLVMVNRYYGWYFGAGDLEAAEQALEAELRGWADRHGKPIIVTEYGADAVAGLHTLHGAVWSEDYQAELLATYHRVFDSIDAVVGEQVWNFADFATAPTFLRVDGNKKGVFTRDRRPKLAAHRLRQRWLDA